MNKVELLSIVVSLSAAGCFVEVDIPSIVFERTCDGSSDCTFRGNAVEQAVSVPMALANGTEDMPFSLGKNSPFKPHYEAGPVNLDGVVVLEKVVITSVGGARLDGIHSLEVFRNDGIKIAGFDNGGGEMLESDCVQLDGNADVNLLEVGEELTLRFAGGGRFPHANWMANIELHMRVSARSE